MRCSQLPKRLLIHFVLGAAAAQCWPSLVSAQIVVGAAARSGIGSSASAPADRLAGAEYLLVEAEVNGMNRGVTLLVRDLSGAFYVATDTLEDWGIARPYPRAIVYGGRALHALRDLRGVELTLAVRTMTAKISIPTEHLGEERVSLGPTRSRGSERELGAYLDYDVSYFQDSAVQQNAFSALLSPTLFTGAGNLSSDMLYRRGDWSLGDGRGAWTRLDTTWTYDDPDRARSLRVGDTVTRAGSWGRSVRIGGVQFETNFSTQPSLVTFPQPSIAGTAAVPSAVDIFVNGSMRSRVDVPDGLFHIDDIPVVTGAGEIQVVTRDLLGREQIITQSFYASEQLLKPGLTDFSISAGRLREDFGLSSNAYGEFLLSGSIRRGLSSELTVDGRLEGTSDSTLLGSGIVAKLRDYGVASASAAFSGGESSGRLWQIVYQYQGRRFRSDVRLQRASRGFVQPGVEIRNGFPKRQIVVSGGIGYGRRGSIGLSLIDEIYHDAALDRQVLSLSYSRPLPYSLSLSASGSFIRRDETDFQAGFVVSRAIGQRTTASASLFSRDDETVLRVDNRYELPLGPGIGYRTSVLSGDERGLDAEFMMNTAFANLSAELRHHESGHGWRLQGKGSLAAVGGALIPSREIGDGFAVVDAGGFEDVRIYLENREVGTTNADGRLLIPRLRPYEANRLRIESADLPLSARIVTDTVIVSPYYKSGAAVSFGVRNEARAMLRVLTEDGSPVAEGARARIAGTALRFPVGLDGRLFLQGPLSGATIEIRDGAHECNFVLGAVARDGPLPELGEVVCRKASSSGTPR
jgi:outer membrane usher protein